MVNVWLPGPPLMGLYGMFEDNYGLSSTPSPYARVTPSKVGQTLLPFHCPSCSSAIDFSDPARREKFHDTRPGRSHHWCPHCGTRFVLNTAAAPAQGQVAIGADWAAASTVERITRTGDGLINVRRQVQAPRSVASFDYLRGTDILSCPPTED